MWDWAIWGALIAGGVAALGTLMLVVVRALQAWRDFKRVRRHVVKTLDSVAGAAERAGETAARVTDSPELERSLRRLSRSLARLAVLRAAIEEARTTFAPAFLFLPRR